MTHCILLSGPPNCGKDTLGRILRERLLAHGRSVLMEKMARPIHESACAVWGPGMNVNGPKEMDQYKDNAVAPGLTLRDWMIQFSESFMKPRCGLSIFGDLLLDRIDQSSGVYGMPDFVIVTDAGFAEECAILYDSLPTKLFHIHRNGASFEGDSRSYPQWEDSYEFTYRVDNWEGFPQSTVDRQILQNISEWLRYGGPI